MSQSFSLKDRLFNAEKVRFLADLFGAAGAEFDTDAFHGTVMSRLPELELKERINWISECLQDCLPGDLPDVAPVVRAALPPPLDPSRTDDDFGDFIFAPLGEFVAAKGINRHPDLSLDLLADLTQRFSMEWAIRPFLVQWPERVLERMRHWTTHDSYHVRRLVSEGTRPRLPWGQAIGLDPGVPLPLLDRLHADPTRYVTRSVANHLNDIARKDPDLVLDRLKHWQGLGAQSEKELGWMTSHALRSLVKAGHPGAMKMLGYDPDVKVGAALSFVDDEVAIGETLELHCELTTSRSTELPVLVDYVVHFPRPGGSVSAKVFKLKTGVVSSAKPLQLRKRHKLKGDATTFTLVPGPHQVEVMVNGTVRAGAEFLLKEPV